MGVVPRLGAEPPLGGAPGHRPLPAPQRRRAGTQACGTRAPAARERAAVSRRRPAGLVRAGPGGERTAEPGPAPEPERGHQAAAPPPPRPVPAGRRREFGAAPAGPPKPPLVLGPRRVRG